MDSSKLFRLKIRDVLLGAVVTIFTAGLLYLQTAMTAPGFDWLNINWAFLLQISLSAGVAYIGKNFLSDDEGKLMGKI